MKRMLTVLAAVISAAVVQVATADVAETKSTLSGGVLTLDVKSGDTLNYTQPINEVTAIVKNGDGKAYLKLGDTLSTFSGTVTVNAGIVGADTPKNWGVPSRVDVMNGASFDLALANGMTANPENLRQVPFYIAGPGASGTEGALFRGAGLGGNVCEHLVEKITLSGDAAVGSSSGRIACNNTVWDLQQHTLTVNGGIYFEGGSFSNPGHVILEKGGAYFDYGFKFNGSAANTLTFKNTAFIEHWSYSGACNWTVNVEGSDQQHGQDYNKYSRICSAYNGTPVWTGPFTVTSGGFSFSAANNRRLDIKDTTIDTTDASCASDVRGPYVQIGSDDKPQSKVFFDNVTMTQLAPNGRSSEFLDIKASNFEWTAPGKAHQLQRVGISSTNAYVHEAGTISAAKTSYLERNVRHGGGFPARLILRNTTWRQTDNLTLAQSDPNAAGLLEFQEGGDISGPVRMAYQGGATVFVNGGALTEFKIYNNMLGDSADSCGAIAVGSGSLVYAGGSITAGNTGRSFIEVRGGTFDFRPSGTTHYLGRDGYAEMFISNGGTFNHADTAGDWFAAWRNNSPAYKADLTGAVLTIMGAGSTFNLGSTTERYIKCCANTTNPHDFVLNLVDGGTLRASRLERNNAAPAATGTPHFYIGFNGGVLKIARSNVFFTNTARTKAPDEMIVYDGGAIVDTDGMAVAGSDAVSRFIGHLKAPSGNCIASIAVPDEAAALCYSHPVRVLISGKGRCATAHVDVDYATCKIRGITVTNPGVDYDEDTVVTIESPNGKSTYACSYELGRQKGTGGLTKRGAGTFCLYDTATYGGALRVEGGTLVGGTDDGVCVFPNDRPLEMAGGELKLGNANYRLDVTDLSGHGKLDQGLYQVKNSFTVDAADLLDGKCLQVPSGFAFSSGVSFAVTGYDRLTEQQKATFDGLRKAPVVRFASRYSGPLPTFDATPFGGKLRLRLSADGKTLLFGGFSGLMVIVK